MRIGPRVNTSPGDASAWIAGIAMLTFANPAASALAPNTLFFTAHGTTTIVGIPMVLAAAGLTWLLAWAVLRLASAASERAFDRTATIATVLVGSLAAWSVVGRLLPRLLPPVAIAAGLVLGIGIALVARRARVGRPLVIVGTATAVLPFALSTLASQPAAAATTATFASDARPDVIWIVADELQYPLVMRQDGTVRDDFPNLQRLQGISTTYARAYTPANYTDYAIPALLNGITDLSTMDGDEIAAMKASRGILDTLSTEYAVVMESPLFSFTCASSDCRNAAPAEGESAAQATWTLLADTAAVVGRTSLAEPLAGAFPELNGKWRDFWSGGDADGGRRIVIPAQQVVDRLERIGSEDPGAPVLALWHSMRSHAPWTVDGQGKAITPHRLPIVEGSHMVGTDEEGHFLTPELADLGYRMYADSTRDLDREVGVLIDALEAQGRLDNALVVFTADHGVTINKVQDRRAGDTETQLWSEAAHVPLMVKRPGQREPETVMEPRSTGQVARSVLDGIGAAADGTTSAPGLDEAPESIVFSHVGVAPMRNYSYDGIAEIDPWTKERLTTLSPEPVAPIGAPADAEIALLAGDSDVAIAVIDGDFRRCADRITVTNATGAYAAHPDPAGRRAWAVVPRGGGVPRVLCGG